AFRVAGTNGNGYWLCNCRLASFSFFNKEVVGFRDTAVLICDNKASVKRAVVVDDLYGGSGVQPVGSGESDGIVGVTNRNDCKFYDLFTIHEWIVFRLKNDCSGIFTSGNGKCPFILDSIKVNRSVIGFDGVLNRNRSEWSDPTNIYNYRYFPFLLTDIHLTLLEMHELRSLICRRL